jgi:hypothetical protein
VASLVAGDALAEQRVAGHDLIAGGRLRHGRSGRCITGHDTEIGEHFRFSSPSEFFDIGADCSGTCRLSCLVSCSRIPRLRISDLLALGFEPITKAAASREPVFYLREPNQKRQHSGTVSATTP